MSHRRSIVPRLSSNLYVLAMMCLAACAQGYSAQPEHSIAPPVEPMAPVFFGESCTIGERIPCDCANGAGTGVRACVANAASPTKGALSECLLCTGMPTSGASALELDAGMQAARDAGRVAAKGGAAGRTAAAGRAAAAGAAARTSSSAGTGGKRSSAGGAGGVAHAGASAHAGSGGAAGSAQPPSTSNGATGACKCNQACAPIGIVACCRSDGSCGCTWAPGAYCL